MSETELFHRLSEDKLRGRARWAGAAMTLSLLMPYEIWDDQPQFLWQLFSELPWAGVVAAASGAIAGVSIIIMRRVVKDGLVLSMAVLAAMFASFIAARFGAEASNWGVLPLPESMTARLTMALLAMSSTAAGASLAHRQHARRASRYLLYGGLAAAILFYVWPGRGRSPLGVMFDHLSTMGGLPTFRHQLGLLTLGVVALWPAIIASVGAVYVKRPPKSAVSALPLTAVFGFPLILMMLLVAWFSRSNPGSALYAAMGASLEIAAVIALGAAALEVWGQATFVGSTAAGEVAGAVEGAAPASWRPPAGHPTRAAAICAASVVGVTVFMWLLGRPPDKGGTWELGSRTEEADALFGRRVTRWSKARQRWADATRAGRGNAEQRVVMREEAERLIAAAEPVGPAVSKALTELVATGEDERASSRAWYGAVARVNDACRQSGLPYYLDPDVRIRRSPEGIFPRFSSHTYFVRRARAFEVDGDAYGILHVEVIRGDRELHGLGQLGLSRDVQPYALVSLDAGLHHVAELSAMAELGSTPRCGRTFDESGDAVLERCGELLTELIQGDLVAATISKVERHELQHQIDGPMLPMARPVLEKLGAYADKAQERANRELSAYVAQLTIDAPGVHVGLVIPVRFALLQSKGTYHHAAVLLFEALSGVTIRNDAGRVDPKRLRPVFARLLDSSEAELRERAAQTWEELYGDALPEVRLIHASVVE